MENQSNNNHNTNSPIQISIVSPPPPSSFHYFNNEIDHESAHNNPISGQNPYQNLAGNMNAQINKNPENSSSSSSSISSSHPAKNHVLWTLQSDSDDEDDDADHNNSNKNKNTTRTKPSSSSTTTTPDTTRHFSHNLPSGSSGTMSTNNSNSPTTISCTNIISNNNNNTNTVSSKNELSHKMEIDDEPTAMTTMTFDNNNSHHHFAAINPNQKDEHSQNQQQQLQKSQMGGTIKNNQLPSERDPRTSVEINKEIQDASTNSSSSQLKSPSNLPTSSSMEKNNMLIDFELDSSSSSCCHPLDFHSRLSSPSGTGTGAGTGTTGDSGRRRESESESDLAFRDFEMSCTSREIARVLESFNAILEDEQKYSSMGNDLDLNLDLNLNLNLDMVNISASGNSNNNNNSDSNNYPFDNIVDNVNDSKMVVNLPGNLMEDHLRLADNFAHLLLADEETQTDEKDEDLLIVVRDGGSCSNFLNSSSNVSKNCATTTSSSTSEEKCEKSDLKNNNCGKKLCGEKSNENIEIATLGDDIDNEDEDDDDDDDNESEYRDAESEYVEDIEGYESDRPMVRASMRRLKPIQMILNKGFDKSNNNSNTNHGVILESPSSSPGHSSKNNSAMGCNCSGTCPVSSSSSSSSSSSVPVQGSSQSQNQNNCQCQSPQPPPGLATTLNSPTTNKILLTSLINSIMLNPNHPTNNNNNNSNSNSTETKSKSSTHHANNNNSDIVQCSIVNEVAHNPIYGEISADRHQGQGGSHSNSNSNSSSNNNSDSPQPSSSSSSSRNTHSHHHHHHHHNAYDLSLIDGNSASNSASEGIQTNPTDNSNLTTGVTPNSISVSLGGGTTQEAGQRTTTINNSHSVDTNHATTTNSNNNNNNSNGANSVASSSSTSSSASSSATTTTTSSSTSSSSSSSSGATQTTRTEQVGRSRSHRTATTNNNNNNGNGGSSSGGGSAGNARSGRTSPLLGPGLRMPSLRWPHRLSSVLALIGCTLGLNNICRFSLLSVEYGANFILQFLFLSLVFGIPLFTFHMSIGQYLGSGIIDMWRISPIFQGIGLGLVISQAMIGIYTAVGVSWVFIYFRDSFITRFDQYRWSRCLREYRDSGCDPFAQQSNLTNFAESIPDYFNGVVLQRSSPDYPTATTLPTNLKFTVAFNLAVVWMLVFVSLSKGLKSYGKVVHGFVLIPVAALLVLASKMVGLVPADQTLFGQTAWANFFFNSQTWIVAAREVFFTWGCLGACVMQVTSHNRFTHSLKSDASIVVLITTFVLLLSAFLGNACYSVLVSHGYSYVPSSFESDKTYKFLVPTSNFPQTPEAVTTSMPSYYNQHISFLMGVRIIKPDVADGSVASGYQALRLATELFPATMSMLGPTGLSPFWTVLFYFTFILFGIAQQIAIWHCVIRGVIAIKPKILCSWEITITFCVCALGFVLGLPLCTEIGIFITYFMDYAIGSGWWIMVLYLLELVAVFIVRGSPYSGECIVTVLMTGGKLMKILAPLVSFIWNVILPVAMLVLSIASFKSGNIRELYDWNPGHGYVFWPSWTKEIGSFLQLVPILAVPFVAIIQSCRYLTNGPPDMFDRMQQLYRPNSRGLFGRALSAHLSGNTPATDYPGSASGASRTGDDPRDDPPKYTPPPSFSTATGAKIAKFLRNSFRRSMRRLGAGNGGPSTSNLDNFPPPPSYNDVILEITAQQQQHQNASHSNSHSQISVPILLTTPPPPAHSSEDHDVTDSSSNTPISNSKRIYQIPLSHTLGRALGEGSKERSSLRRIASDITPRDIARLLRASFRRGPNDPENSDGNSNSNSHLNPNPNSPQTPNRNPAFQNNLNEVFQQQHPSYPSVPLSRTISSPSSTTLNIDSDFLRVHTTPTNINIPSSNINNNNNSNNVNVSVTNVSVAVGPSLVNVNYPSDYLSSQSSSLTSSNNLGSNSNNSSSSPNEFLNNFNFYGNSSSSNNNNNSRRSGVNCHQRSCSCGSTRNLGVGVGMGIANTNSNSTDSQLVLISHSNSDLHSAADDLPDFRMMQMQLQLARAAGTNNTGIFNPAFEFSQVNTLALDSPLSQSEA